MNINTNNLHIFYGFTYSRIVSGINTWALLLVRYLGAFLKWTRKHLKQMDHTIKKTTNDHAWGVASQRQTICVKEREGKRTYQ